MNTKHPSTLKPLGYESTVGEWRERLNDLIEHAKPGNEEYLDAINTLTRREMRYILSWASERLRGIESKAVISEELEQHPKITPQRRVVVDDHVEAPPELCDLRRYAGTPALSKKIK